MPRPSSRFLFRFAVASALVASAACAVSPAGKRHRDPVEPGDEYYTDDTLQESPLDPSSVNNDSGAFGASSRPKPDAGGEVDAGADSSVGPKVVCTGPMAAGDLGIVEIMIASRAGSGDEGEWVEIRNRRSCWLAIQGVTVESPRGAALNVATVGTPVELAPGETFVVANSLDAAKNHALPGTVVAWSVSDVLKNDGDVISVKLGATVIDTLSYPSFTNLPTGRSIAFPSDCEWGDRTDWARWSLTFDVFSPGFQGTPNAANDDVTCY